MTESGVPPVRWRAATPTELRWAHWGGDHVLFHVPSGITHLVNGATASLLRDVLAAPRTIEEAARRLAALDGAEPELPYVAEVAALMGRLEALGLVERVAD